VIAYSSISNFGGQIGSKSYS